MSCEYWAPKSRMRMRWAWMSAAKRALLRAVIRCLFDDRHVMHVALAHAGRRDAHECRSRAHLLDRAAARVAHRCAQAARELVHDGADGALVGHASLDAFRNELLDLVG